MNEHFDKIDFKKQPIIIGEYEQCVFTNCDFAHTDLSQIIFTDCEFVHCNLSIVKLVKTAFREVIFKDCKMMGLHFEDCNEFGLLFKFENCVLNHSVFYQTKLRKTTFKHAQLQEVDFTGCDLTASVFEHCDFTAATFDNTILEKVDFRTSSNYSIDPEKNKIKNAIFSLSGVQGLLDKYSIKIDTNN